MKAIQSLFFFGLVSWAQIVGQVSHTFEASPFLETFKEEAVTQTKSISGNRWIKRFKGKRPKKRQRQQRKRQQEELLTPGEILNIGSGQMQNHFELQLSKSGEPAIEVISQQQIAAGFEDDPYFIPVSRDTYETVQFLVQVDAPTTSGSLYPRCELRQTDEFGDLTSFDAMHGTYSLHGKTAITHLPPVKPEVVIAQLFNGEADAVAIRTQFFSGKINLVVRVNGHVVKPLLASPYVLGAEFEWKIVVQDGIASIYYNDMETPIISNQQLSDTGRASWYFKAGCYAQTNNRIESDPSEYVSVDLRDLLLH